MHTCTCICRSSLWLHIMIFGRDLVGRTTAVRSEPMPSHPLPSMAERLLSTANTVPGPRTERSEGRGRGRGRGRWRGRDGECGRKTLRLRTHYPNSTYLMRLTFPLGWQEVGESTLYLPPYTPPPSALHSTITNHFCCVVLLLPTCVLFTHSLRTSVGRSCHACLQIV